jgi:hypothetical protein
MLRSLLAISICVALASPARVAAAPARDVAARSQVDDEAPAEPGPAADASGDATAPVAVDEPVEGDAPTEDETVADPPAPRSAFAPTPPPKPGDGVPEAPLAPGVPGGYEDLGRSTRGREPPDGDDEVLAGSIIFPLGIISVGSSAATIWLSAPGHCESRWQSLGASPDHDQCKGLYAFGWVRAVYGGLMVITGAALLGVGLHRRHKHALWKRGYASRPRIVPWLARGGGGVSITLRLDTNIQH